MALKVITPSFNTGTDPVGTDDYRAGMIACRDANGNARVCGNESTKSTVGPLNKPIGIFGEDRITTTLQQTDQALEEITVTSGVAVALAHNGLVTNSERIVNKGTGSAYVRTTNYTIDFANGTVTSVNIPSGTVVQVTYTFKLNDDAEKNFRGVNFKGSIDDTAGSKKATVWKGYGEFSTDQFVTSQAYLVGDDLRITHSAHDMGAGLLSNEASSAAVVNIVVGRVTTVPTAAQPFLGFEWQGSLVDPS